MREKRNKIIECVIILIVLLVLCVTYNGSMEEVMGVVIGYMLAKLSETVFEMVQLYNEDRNKISDRHFPYEKERYLQKVRVGNQSTQVWYEPCVSAKEDQKLKFVIEDRNQYHFQLDPLISSNYQAIFEAHKASFTSNAPMIRLDDYVYDQEKQTLVLNLSRTTFYNDLVTNRAMDYKFGGELTIRDIFECKRLLTPLCESKLSNHIGINGLVFYRGKLLLAKRGSNSTISKKGITASIAIGLSEEVFRKDYYAGQEETEHEYIEEGELFEPLLLEYLSDKFDISAQEIRDLAKQGEIKTYFLGLGRLIYTGGKPQFYYAMTISDHCDLKIYKSDAVKEAVDYNAEYLLADQIELKTPGSYDLIVTASDTKKQQRIYQAEKSFYANWMHLLEYGRIEGIPDWVYQM